jgi:hypothetical protein
MRNMGMRGHRRRLREMEEGETLLSKDQVIENLKYYEELGEGTITVSIPNLSGNAIMQMHNIHVKFSGNMCFIRGKDWQVEFGWNDLYFVASGETDWFMTAYAFKNDKAIFTIYGR